MRIKSALLAFAISILLTSSPASVAATEYVDPAVWFGLGAASTWPPAELGFGYNGVSDNLFGPAGILGVKIIPALGLEARGTFLSTSDLNDLDVSHFEGQLTGFLAPGKRFVPFLTAGVGKVREESDTMDEKDTAYNGGGGFLFRFNDELAFRADARYMTYKVEDFVGEEDWRPQTEVFAGLSLGLGGKPKDSDKDGVPDRDDACAATPAGARVDLKGCPVDGDKDGVPDGIDTCDGTPQGARVDAKGCPSDADGDGVFDGIDTCADTPAHVLVDAAGCPLDGDGDKVFDGPDQCPDTPKGCTVDANGCPADADKDGVCDGLDQCADTPADVRVDLKGCPLTEKEVELLDTGMIRLHDVNFQSGKAKLLPDSYPALDEVGNILTKWPGLQLEVGGHTDSQGSDAFNQKLSDDRAKAVVVYLVTKFTTIKPEQLTSAGYGETKPIAPNDTSLNRAKNRRVEFKVMNTEDLRRVKEKMAPK